jgi:hypothetical protein
MGDSAVVAPSSLKEDQQASINRQWWKELDVEDPISLEPIRNLAHAPFVLTGATGGKHFFDGTSLSTYILATGRFENPLTREALSQDDCQRLDRFLAKHTQTVPTICRRFDEKHETSSATSIFTEEPEDPFAAEQRQREASTVLLSLFSFGRGSDGPSHRGQIRPINQSQAGQPSPPDQELFQFTIGDDPTRWDTDTLVKRNKILVKAIKRRLQGDSDGFNTFRQDSQQLRSGESSAAEYYDRFLQVVSPPLHICIRYRPPAIVVSHRGFFSRVLRFLFQLLLLQMFGSANDKGVLGLPQASEKLFQQLVSLLPDTSKRLQLRQVHISPPKLSRHPPASLPLTLALTPTSFGRCTSAALC